MLIKSTDLLEAKSEVSNQIEPYRTAGSNRFAIGVIGKELDDIIGELRTDENIHIPTRGHWSNHNLLSWLLKRTGPAKVWITSWTISEIAVRTLIQLIDSGLIQEIHCLFDERIKVNCPQAYQLVEREVVDLKLTKIHAKSLVILNDNWGISVTTSANFTRNPRIEKYVICSARNIAEQDARWITQELALARPFEMDNNDYSQP